MRAFSKNVVRLFASWAVLPSAAIVVADTGETFVRLPQPTEVISTRLATGAYFVNCNGPSCNCPGGAAGDPSQGGAAGVAPASPDSGMGSSGFGDEQFAGLGGDSMTVNSLVGGYIDPAVIQSRVRVRYDIDDFANFPTRAEYLYPSSSNNGGRGPAGIVRDLRLQELHTYVEWAWGPKFSIFGDFSARYVDGLAGTFNPIAQDTRNHQLGAGDTQAGFRWGIIADPQGAYNQMLGNYLTAQVRAYLPTGDPQLGLGTGHTSVEAGLLFQRQTTENLTVFGEILDWTAIGASVVSGTGTGFDGQRFGGNVLQWGLGASYAVYSDCYYGCPRRLALVYEVVGWNVLDGLVNTPGGNVADADGDTIINGKYGVRWISGLNTVYVGYGQNYTHDRWYADIYRVEFAHAF